MAIIDYTYFVGKINLPTDNANYQNKLQLYIDEVQEKYLIYALGYELYSLFIADLPTPSAQRFTDLLDGVEYNDSLGRLTKWKGLANSDKKSLLAYFAAFEYSRNSQVYESGNGVKANLNENADRVSPISFQVTAYNLGVELYKELFHFLYQNQDDYPEWDYRYFRELQEINTFNL